MNFIDVRLRRC